MDLHEKLKKYMEKEGLRQQELASRMGMTQPTVHRILKGDWEGQLQKMEKAIRLLGGKVSFDPGASPDYAFVRQVEAMASAGSGSLVNGGGEYDMLAFKKTWLASKTTSSVEQLSVMTVWGDSMLPTLADKDAILVDEGAAGQELLDGRVYVLRVGDEVFVKRFRKAVGKVFFISDNRDFNYQNIELEGGEIDQCGIIGRVLWAGREI